MSAAQLHNFTRNVVDQNVTDVDWGKRGQGGMEVREEEDHIPIATLSLPE